MSRLGNGFFVSLALGVAMVPTLWAPVFAQAPTTPPQTVAPTPEAGQDVFYKPSAGQKIWRTSDMIGEGVFNRAGERIGEVDELIIDATGRVAAAIIGVGGFLGLGERLVAVSFSALDLTLEANGNPRLVVDLTKDTLATAPAYRPDLKRN
jgi:sporulation protein YlmC with PRC-barrel domain